MPRQPSFAVPALCALMLSAGLLPDAASAQSPTPKPPPPVLQSDDGAAASPMRAAVAAPAWMLRIRQTQLGGNTDYQLLRAAQGRFGPQPPLPEDRTGDLLVIGRDAAGRELFRRAVRNPGAHRAEIFDPATGRIAFAQSLQTSGGVVEVRVPDDPALVSVDLVERADVDRPWAAHRSGTIPTPVRRFSRQELDAAAVGASIDNGRTPLTGGADRAFESGALAAPSGSAWLWQSGATNARMDLILIGDGYTAAQMAKWQADARKVADGFLADPLFAKHKGHMNILRADVASQDSGVTEGGVTRRTALGTVIGCYNTPRLVCANETLVYDTVGAITPADGRDVIVVVANSQTYGGSGGNVGVMTMHPQAIEVGLHEIGHTAFKLADEYDYGTCNVPREPGEANVTLASTKAAAKWGDLIASSTTVPTPKGYYPNGTVGLFVGGKYCTSGVYRPTEDSRMRTLNRPWHAVNERRVQTVFNGYGGGSTPGNGTTATGTLSGAGQIHYIPTGAFYSANGGSFSARLTGPSGANFDLLLYKWNGSAWTMLARSSNNGSTESLTYTGSAGYYYAAVQSISGNGGYQVTYSFPR